jgi:hypothetical protein
LDLMWYVKGYPMRHFSEQRWSIQSHQNQWRHGSKANKYPNVYSSPRARMVISAAYPQKNKFP